MEVSEMTPEIYLGTNQCCQAHYDLLLISKGVTHDISLEGEHVDQPYGADSYLWLPTEDRMAPSPQTLMLGVDYIDDVIARGGKVYIHCKNGHGRAPTLLAAWYVSHGSSVNEALAAVKAKRPEVHLEDAQVEALRAYARSL
jgi:protein-tyrosine phosphatase